MVAVEAVIILILIGINGAFALMELSLVSARRAQLQQRSAEGDKRAQTALEFLKEPSRFLSTVQIGITLVGIFAGAFGGATLSKELGQWLLEIGLNPPYHEIVAFGAVVLMITYLTLVFGELVPKRIALTNPTSIAIGLSPFVRVLGKITSPFTRVLSASTELVVKIMGIKTDQATHVSDEEITMLLRQGIRSGQFRETELAIVEQLFKLSDRPITTIMTPRSEIIWLNITDSPEAAHDKMIKSYRSRFPVCGENLDEVQGIIEVKALFPLLAQGELDDIRPLMRQPVFVSEQASVVKVIEQMRAAKLDTAIVVDEYGSVQGIVTSNDILKSLLGDVISSDEPTEPDYIEETRDGLLIRGQLSLAELSAQLEIESLPEISDQVTTLGGLAMVMLQRIPQRGDKFRVGRYRFEVIEMDGHRVERVRVVKK